MVRTLIQRAARVWQKPARGHIARRGRRAPNRGGMGVGVLLAARDAVVASIVGLLMVSIAPVLLGWHTTVVVSGSMAPQIEPGDVIAAAPTSRSPRPGTIVLVDDPARPGDLLMHRLVRYDPEGRMILKGDANEAPDSTPVNPGSLRGVPRLRIPLIGLPYVWIRQGLVVPAVAAVVLLLLIVVWEPPGTSSRAGGAHRRRILPDWGKRTTAGVAGYRYQPAHSTRRRIAH